ncbi:hypothetical protein GPECTOR_47g320 [Gonium pectorale]|uniref:Uncharacterized protein n=1 Tax=Gonium pectorale TaxID=33097 RepID=A0A150G917_GONPE|nr:hypothetical protein GPECTOR_47g320 [Gonium pectorale]|eukprot:KXZ46045.1 hypothetical protein GPECTOR_47g320 [Gonium pectorale]
MYAGRHSGSPRLGAAQVSLVILNIAVPEGTQAEVAAALLDMLTSAPGGGGGGAAAGGGGGGSKAVTLVAGMLMQHVSQPAALYQLQLNGAKPLDPSLPQLPVCSGTGAPSAAAAARARVRDGQLAALLHVAAVSGTPLACLLAPGHKPPAATSLVLPDSAAACDALGAAVAAALGLSYDAAACRTVRASCKWFVPESAAGSDIMYL